ncbi:BMP/retinoic acid-inducible neural-specific protein 2 [Lates japonicus]|uniref:BMP/retinoic acid-inducible neural-specific protein 2 n=1 Tax=Lates japonicus TaxID=270547 RepID=A0AAD3RAG1_LATJO|nr:BMP/retinoic acid-inducible neural-specific protein 2 [Lates japonicus]
MATSYILFLSLSIAMPWDHYLNFDLDMPELRRPTGYKKINIESVGYSMHFDPEGIKDLISSWTTPTRSEPWLDDQTSNLGYIESTRTKVFGYSMLTLRHQGSDSPAGLPYRAGTQDAAAF